MAISLINNLAAPGEIALAAAPPLFPPAAAAASPGRIPERVSACYDEACGGRVMAELSEKEEEAWRQGEYVTCCKYGLLTRVMCLPKYVTFCGVRD